MFISLVSIKLVALRFDRYTRSSSQFQKGCDPWCTVLCFLGVGLEQGPLSCLSGNELGKNNSKK